MGAIGSSRRSDHIALWRPRLGWWVSRGMLPVVVGAMAAVGYVMAPGVDPDDMALFGLFCLVGASLLYAVGRPRIVARHGGLTVVNLFRRRELEWAEVVAVAMPEGEPWPTLDLADGSTLAVMGIQSADGDRARRHLGELRALLESRGTSAEPD